MNNLYQIKPKNNYNSRAIIKIIILLLILFGTLLYILTFSFIPSINSYTYFNDKLNFLSNYYNNDSTDVNNKLYNQRSYFVNSIGCKMPGFPIIDECIEKYLLLLEPVKCGTPLFYSNNTHLWFDINNFLNFSNITNNITDINLLKCYYDKLIRISDNKNKVFESPQVFDINKSYIITDEFVKVYCNYGDLKNIYSDYHYFVQPVQEEDNKNNSNYDNQINVLIFGLDSLSRLNFRRQMNMTSSLLLNKLNGIELQGYNKVGDNTYPNLIPVLTGLDSNELQYSCLKNSKDTYDKCNFIWNKYKLKNFKTMFTEDLGYMGLFNYFKSGFKQPPTGYYTRPIIIEMEKKLANSRKGNIFMCLGNRSPNDIFMEHINKLLTSNYTKNQRKFGMFWSASMTHDDFNLPIDFDSKTAEFIENLHINNHLNDSILFVMSDHGIRWGSFRNTYQGMVEERQPMLIAIIPEWFKQKYNLAIMNFERNIHRLTTHYDLYETLNDLTDLSNLLPDNIKMRTKELHDTNTFQRGISLFLTIPLSRTCESAGIEDHWCTCFEREKLSNKDIRVQNVAHFTVKELNKMLIKYPQCQKLYLNKIKDASIDIMKNGLNLNSFKPFYDITIQLQTKPGYGEFEATVRIIDVQHKNKFELTGTISRTNLYGQQSSCTDDYQMKLYCVCGR